MSDLPGLVPPEPDGPDALSVDPLNLDAPDLEPTHPEPRDLSSHDPDPLNLDAADLEPTHPEPADSDSAALAPAPAGPLGDLVAAHFGRVEVAMLGRVLTTTLAGALPPAMVRVERHRTLMQRLTGRPGVPVGVSITAEDKTLTFRSMDVGEIESTVSHTVRGVVLSTTAVAVPVWLDELAAVLGRATENDRAIRAALERALLS